MSHPLYIVRIHNELISGKFVLSYLILLHLNIENRTTVFSITNLSRLVMVVQRCIISHVSIALSTCTIMDSNLKPNIKIMTKHRTQPCWTTELEKRVSNIVTRKASNTKTVKATNAHVESLCSLGTSTCTIWCIFMAIVNWSSNMRHVNMSWTIDTSENSAATTENCINAAW